MNIVENFLDRSQYFRQEYKKFGIVIHHTAGGPNPINVITGWNMNPIRVGTAFIIAGKSNTEKYKEGYIHQAFPSKYWAHHIGNKAKDTPKGGMSALKLHQGTIAIEICNWGGLTKTKEGKFLNYVNLEVSESEVIEYETPFKGFKYYQKYTDLQIESLRELLIYLCNKYDIPKKYNSDMWDLSLPAFKGTPGIYTHVSYRKDKMDCHPQPELIEMLKSLSK